MIKYDTPNAHDLLTDEEADRADELDALSSPGPWKLWTSNSNRRIGGPTGADGDVLYGTPTADGHGDIAGPRAERDLRFAVHARTLLPRAVRTVRYLWERLRQSKQAEAAVRVELEAARARCADLEREVESLRDAVRKAEESERERHAESADLRQAAADA